MGRTLTEDRKILKDWAIILAGLGMKHKDIAHWLGTYKGQIDNWLFGENIPNQEVFILNQEGTLISNSGIKIKNFRDGLPPNPKPQLWVGKAEDLKFLEKESVDIIITSPPYNLGQEKWPMGGNGRTPRDAGIGYSEFEDAMTFNFLFTPLIYHSNDIMSKLLKNASLRCVYGLYFPLVHSLHPYC